MARSCHPVGLINAGDPENAVTDVFEVGQLYQTTNSRGIQWAAITALAVAAATKPQATLDSVLAAILQGDPRFTPDTGVVREIDRGFKLTAGCGDFHELRKTLDAIYSGTGTNEVVTKAVCVFRFGKGNVRDTLAAAVGMGRDAGCVAAISSGLAGALSGGSTIPTELVKQHLRQTSDALYEAYRERLRKMRTYAEVMETA